MTDDETFISFQESNSRIIVPSGEKRFGSAKQFNEKGGCTLMVTMDFLSSLCRAASSFSLESLGRT